LGQSLRKALFSTKQFACFQFRAQHGDFLLLDQLGTEDVEFDPPRSDTGK